MTTRSEPAVEECGRNHPMTPENTYVTPVTHYRKCKTCQREDREQRPKAPSRAKAPKPPIDPAIVAQLRAAAGNPKGLAQ